TLPGYSTPTVGEVTNRREVVVQPAVKRPGSALSARPQLEQLEDRQVLSVSFGPAFAIGAPGGAPGRDVANHATPPASLLRPLRDAATNATGNVYLTGPFRGTVDFNPAHPNTDGILQKCWRRFHLRTLRKRVTLTSTPPLHPTFTRGRTIS